MTRDEVGVIAVGKAWDAWWEEPGGLGERLNPNCCILATRLACKVLGRFGIPAWPVPTVTAYLNVLAEQCLRANMPVEAWPEGAWSIGVGEHATGPGYPGHLWMATANWMLDLSARQFDRPLKGLRAPGSMMLPRPHPFREPVGARIPGGVLVTLAPLHDFSYRSAPDWRERWRTFADEFLARTEAVLATAVSEGEA